MKKYFIVSDVHSFYDELMKGLEDAGFDFSNPNHIFVSLGDLFDRGPKACECLQFVNSLPKKRKILIRGNHETLMNEVFIRGYFKSHDYHNCTNETIEQFFNANKQDDQYSLDDSIPFVQHWEEYKKYTDCLINYKIIKNNIFVHGWIPYWCKTLADLKYTNWVDWYDAAWDNGMQCWHNGSRLRTSNRKDGKLITVFCGHFHTSYGNSRYHEIGTEWEADACFDPFIDEGIVALDACTVYSHKVNVYVLEV